MTIVVANLWRTEADDPVRRHGGHREPRTGGTVLLAVAVSLAIHLAAGLLLPRSDHAVTAKPKYLVFRLVTRSRRRETATASATPAPLGGTNDVPAKTSSRQAPTSTTAHGRTPKSTVRSVPSPRQGYRAGNRRPEERSRHTHRVHREVHHDRARRKPENRHEVGRLDAAPVRARHTVLAARPTPAPVGPRQPSRRTSDTVVAQAAATPRPARAPKPAANPARGTSRSPTPRHQRGASAFLRELARWIAGHRRYPRLARIRGWQGVATVRVVVSEAGRTSVTLVRSSGYPLLDRQARELVGAALESTKRPASHSRLAILVPVKFVLRN